MFKRDDPHTDQPIENNFKTTIIIEDKILINSMVAPFLL